MRNAGIAYIQHLSVDIAEYISKMIEKLICPVPILRMSL
jgi:hypothetical protein